jgi:hypothetical protein
MIRELSPEELKKRYDREKCPFPGSEKDWMDFCDWMNKEGIYADENAPIFPSSYFFISFND